jgi:hypothetical protein
MKRNRERKIRARTYGWERDSAAKERYPLLDGSAGSDDIPHVPLYPTHPLIIRIDRE